MFEAVHGSAPDIAGHGVANPSGLLVAAAQMLVHLGASDTASLIKNAWLRTLEDGIHTPDIYREGLSEREVGTEDFTQAVIERLGDKPDTLEPVAYRSKGISVKPTPTPDIEKELVGIDVFIDWDEDGRDPNVIGQGLEECNGDGMALEMITNRGVKVYPSGMPETFWTDHWRCRFSATDGPVTFKQILSLLERIDEDGGFEVIKTEQLYTFDGERGFSLGQGQ
jgi:isocitrate dehydrogenase